MKAFARFRRWWHDFFGTTDQFDTHAGFAHHNAWRAAWQTA